ncbi:hypothetical protein EMIT079MI2_180081 [Bacillus sp. IT-79MI2]
MKKKYIIYTRLYVFYTLLFKIFELTYAKRKMKANLLYYMCYM